MRGHRRHVLTCAPKGLALVLLMLVVQIGVADVIDKPENPDKYDRDRALSLSQGAVGNTLGDYQFLDSLNRPVSLLDFRGKPLVISMIFTSCHHICPATTKRLDFATRAAREVLGQDSFEIISIGFDTLRDTPDAMRAFAREQGVFAANWQFLSGSAENIDALAHDLGFVFFPSPRGFDHLNQVTIIDRQGVVYNQVYGVSFELPWLVEPLKALVLNRPQSQGHVLASLVDRVRLFCTVYNPASGRYEIDNSLFIQIAIGFIIVLSGAIYLWRGFHPARNT